MVKIRHYVQIFLLVFCTGCTSVRTATPTMPTLPAAPTTTTALTLTTVPPPPTSILPTNTSPLPVDNAVGLIAYCSDQDGDFEIWVMNVDGSNQQKLTDNNAMDISPAWSPDGSPIGWVERYYPACQSMVI
jgi:hypothetical protein